MSAAQVVKTQNTPRTCLIPSPPQLDSSLIPSRSQLDSLAGVHALDHHDSSSVGHLVSETHGPVDERSALLQDTHTLVTSGNIVGMQPTSYTNTHNP